MKRHGVFGWLSCVLAVSGLSAQQAGEPAVLEALLAKHRPTRVEFQLGLIGDQQYTAEQEAQFPTVIRAMDREPLAFVVHDGDFKGGQRCTDELCRNRLELFQSSEHPFIYTPGDNDWTDCHTEQSGGYDPLERLARLRQLFYADSGQSLGKRRMSLTSQSEQRRFQLFKENLLWTTGEVVFATIHAVGSNNGLGRSPGGDAEFQARNEANVSWLRTAFSLARAGRFQAVMLITQANPRFEQSPESPGRRGFNDLVAALEEETRAFGKPVVLVHGDSHYFRIDKPLLQGQGREAPERQAFVTSRALRPSVRPISTGFGYVSFRRIRTFSCLSLRSGHRASQPSIGADAPSRRCRQVVKARGSFEALAGLAD